MCASFPNVLSPSLAEASPAGPMSLFVHRVKPSDCTVGLKVAERARHARLVASPPQQSEIVAE